MRRLEMATRVSGLDSARMYELLCDTERYPDLTDAIESLRVEQRTATTAVSTWRVRFRNGILQWTEADVYDPKLQTIEFDQIEGDFDSFSGAWSVDSQEQGCIVRFTAQFDFGMPTLAPMVDPIAEAALRENVAQIVARLSECSVEAL